MGNLDRYPGLSQRASPPPGSLSRSVGEPRKDCLLPLDLSLRLSLDIATHKRAQLLDHRISYLIVDHQALLPPGDQTCLGQHLQVLRDVRLTSSGLLDDLTDALLPLHQATQNRQPGRIPQHPELLRHRLEHAVGNYSRHLLDRFTNREYSWLIS